MSNILVHLKAVVHVMLTISVAMLQDVSSGQYTIVYIMQCKNLVTTRGSKHVDIVGGKLELSWFYVTKASVRIYWPDLGFAWHTYPSSACNLPGRDVVVHITVFAQEE